MGGRGLGYSDLLQKHTLSGRSPFEVITSLLELSETLSIFIRTTFEKRLHQLVQLARRAMANYPSHPYVTMPAQTTNRPDLDHEQTNDDDATGKKKKTTKRRKVNHACLYCRRSHMTCDEGRPCQRWCVRSLNVTGPSCITGIPTSIKREIGHLCHDEQRLPRNKQDTTAMPHSADTSRIIPRT